MKLNAPLLLRRIFSNGLTVVEYVAKYLGWEEFKSSWRCSFFDRYYEQQGHNYAILYATASEILNPIFSCFLNKFRLVNQLNAVIKHHPDVGKGDFIFHYNRGNNIMGATAYNNVKVEKVLK